MCFSESGVQTRAVPLTLPGTGVAIVLFLPKPAPSASIPSAEMDAPIYK